MKIVDGQNSQLDRRALGVRTFETNREQRGGKKQTNPTFHNSNTICHAPCFGRGFPAQARA